jgi:demethylmenaquinone methyltransferase/2-methoxy-6-polyprenyl-1,4-benzoquinol methylase
MSLDKSEKTMGKMFNSIAQRYDLMNDLMTFFSHRYTRNFMCNLITFSNKKKVLDLATGTGDNIIYLKRKFPKISITGVDLSEEMLKKAVIRLKTNNSNSNVKLLTGDILNLPFEENFFDFCTISYGIRNVSNILTALQEVNRVTKPGGSLIVVEATRPNNSIVNYLSEFHFQHVIPKLARIFSSNHKAYDYLFTSIKSFPSNKRFINLMENGQWSNIRSFSLLFGAVTIYQGIK